MFVSENTTEAKILRQQFEYHRGQVVSSFAHCEYFIGKFLLAIEDSDEFIGKFAFPVEGRIKKFREVFEKNHSLKNTQEDAILLIDSYEKVIKDRNDFVHGLARLDVSKREVTMERISPVKGDLSAVTIATYKLDNLEEKVRIFDRICRSIIALILNIDSQFKLGLSSIYGTETKVWVPS